MAIMADFARMPTDRKILVFSLIALALGGLYYQVSYKSLRDNVASAQTEHGQKLAQIRKLDGDIPKYEALKQHVAALRKIIDENEQALPVSTEMPAFLEMINRKVKESGVEVKRQKELGENKVDGFIRVPVEIEMTGTFLQIKKFFALLTPKKHGPADPNASGDDEETSDTAERIVSIENLSLTDPVIRNHQIFLTAHFVAATFRQDESSPGATAGLPLTTAPAPAAPASSAPASSAPPAKLPPANTPQGAKMRVEDSLHKADVRDRNAAGVDEAKTPAAPAAPAAPPAGGARQKGGL